MGTAFQSVSDIHRCCKIIVACLKTKQIIQGFLVGGMHPPTKVCFIHKHGAVLFGDVCLGHPTWILSKFVRLFVYNRSVTRELRVDHHTPNRITTQIKFFFLPPHPFTL